MKTTPQIIWLKEYTLDSTLADTPPIDVASCRSVAVGTRGTPGAIDVYVYPFKGQEPGSLGGDDDHLTAVFYDCQSVSDFTITANQSIVLSDQIFAAHYMKLVSTNDSVAVQVWGKA